MKITGIICEYDPFHNGHAYLIERARENGDFAVCVMSGHFTQRGSIAVADKYTRAEAAVRCGADLVLELPYPYCSASAEYFAAAGTAILDSVGAGRICFGSECGDVEVLGRFADLALSLGESEDRGEQGTASRYFAALERAYRETFGEVYTPAPNDILGIEYLKAIRRGGYEMEPLVVKRLGDGFRDDAVGASPYASATALRQCIRQDATGELDAYMPKESRRLLAKAIERGDAPTDVTRLESAILSFFRLADPSRLSHIAELGNGLEHRLCRAACEARTLEEFFALSATKKYTDARIRRAVFFAMLGVRRVMLEALPSYTNLLAANEGGRELLASVRRKESKIAVVTKPADGQVIDARQYALSLAADSLFTLTLPKSRPAGDFIKKSAVIL